MAKQTLDQWIHEALVDPDKEGKCTSLALIHMTGVREQEIHTVKLGDRQWDPKELARLFRGKAENHAAEIAGVQTYNLLAFYANRGEPQARKPIMIQGETEFAGLATEGPTKDGMLQQMMRHNEAIVQMAFRQTAMLFETTNRALAEASTANHRLTVENRENFEIIKEVALKMATNREESAMKQLTYERTSAERSKWLSMVPALANGIMNREVFPQAAADTALIDSIAESLSEADIMKLATSGILKPELMGPLAQRMAKSLEKKRMMQESHMQIANGIDPEDDAAGGPDEPSH